MLWRGAAVVLALIVGAAMLSPWLAPFDPAAQDLALRLVPPLSHGADGWHLLGTDALGRDVLSRLIVAARASLLVSLAAVAVSGVVGVLLGILGGYDDRRGGRVILALADIQLAVPFLVLAIAVVAVLGPGLVNVAAVLGLTSWMQYARIVRIETLSLRERAFVEAARAVGAGTARILARHLLPNVMPSIVIVSSLQFARMILFEASLSYLGLGVPRQIPSWGGMVADGRNYVADAWWVAAIPGIAIFATVISVNLLGDRLRDVLARA